VLLYHCAFCPAQDASDGQQLFSPSVADKFYEMAYELGDSPEISETDIDQAIALLRAATSLDSRAKYVLPDIIKLASRHPSRDYSQLMYTSLVSYVDESADLEVCKKAVRYLLDHLDSREERERLLQQLLRDPGSRNDVLASELATELGLLMTEKTELQTAQYYLVQAYNKNNHNRLAFAKLVELLPEQIEPAVHLGQFRLALSENPLDVEAAWNFAQYTEKLQLYDIATDAYEYCADLLKYLNPSVPAPASLYLPWAISSYNTERSQHKCLRIASEFRQTGRFNLLLEAIAGKVAAQTGDQPQAERILKDAEEKALAMLKSSRVPGVTRPGLEDSGLQQVSPRQLAWFYCFVVPDENKSLEWANEAYSSDPNSASAAAILAYSLVANGQNDSAKLLINDYPRSQISDLAMAQIQLAQKQRAAAIETLNAAIARDPGSLAAERAKEILAQEGVDYVPEVDPDVAVLVLRNEFGQAVPTFLGPDRLFSVQLKLRGSKFAYAQAFDASVAITNNSTEPLIISDVGLFKGNIRVDANVTGDINRKIPNLVSVKIRPTLPVEPGRNISVPVQLATGELRETLLSFPQASLDIEFTIYADPVVNDRGFVVNAFSDLKPHKVLVKRPGVELSTKYLQNRLNSVAKGRQGQRIKTAQLFAGLLMEHKVMTNRQPVYKLMHADWMPAMLQSALVRTLADDDWVVRVQAMAAMSDLGLDYELKSSLAKNLNDTHWPCRLMALRLLAESKDSNFSKVLDWTAKYDSSELVRNMAVALGGKEPEKPSEPARRTSQDGSVEPTGVSILSDS
jgi:hypothetical protein